MAEMTQKSCLALFSYSSWNILCTDMKSDKFIGTARMVSMYDRKYNVILKHVEINSSGQNSGRLPQPQQTSHRFLRWN